MDRDVTDTARAIKIGIVLPAALGSSADPDWVREFAQQTETLGFDEISVIEHSVVIADTSSTYPYSPTGRSPLADDCVIPDPLELLAFMAGCTSRVGLSTGVLVLPNHQPVVLAKRLATLDRLSAGRLRICIGVGWMREEVEACGGHFADRGRFTDEAIIAMRALWTGTDPAGVTFDGEFVSFKGAFSYPKPYRSSGVPLHIGGHSLPAARRAGRLGDGFQPLGLAGDDLDAVLAEVRRAALAAGRDPAEIELVLGATVSRVDEQSLADAQAKGAARVLLSLSPKVTSLEQALQAMADCSQRLGLAA